MAKHERLKNTGERLLTDKKNATAIHHLHRYAVALDLVESKYVIDIACGEGYGSHLLSMKAEKVVGIDISDDAVNHAKEKYNAENLSYKVGAANAIPIEDNSIDVVVSFETIEHHNDHQGMLTEIRRVLKEGGTLLISSPDKKNYSQAIGKTNPFHVKELFKEEFSDLIASFFNHHKLYDQHNGFHSLISSADGQGEGFREYNGDFEHLNQHMSQQVPVYNLCIASDDAEKCKLSAAVSTFNGEIILEQMESQVSEIKNSMTYRIGYYLTLPFRWIRNL